MKDKINLAKTRNIGLAAHIDAGKTTTTERILFYTGRVHRMGEVDDGDATMDWMPQESERGITITSAATTCRWRDHCINIIDTPGHVDFTVEVERTMRVLDGLVLVVCAVGGVQAQTETVWRQAEKYRVPRMVFVNKLDRSGANFHDVLHQMRSALSANVVATQIPLQTDDEFAGIIDLVRMRSIRWHGELGAEMDYGPIPEDHQKLASKFREYLIVSLAEIDPQIEKKFFAEQVPAEADLLAALRQGTVSGDLVPVSCGSALKNRGIQPLMDDIVDFLPSPLDVPSIEGKDPKTGQTLLRTADLQVPFAALVFKVVSDPFVGQLSYTRVYSGRAEQGDTVYNTTADARHRIGRALRMHANRREEIEEVWAGDIVALVGMDDANTGDTLCDPNEPIVLEKIAFPEPVITMAIEPRTAADEDKLDDALRVLTVEDPTFATRVNPETDQRVIAGMGELHLEIIKDRLLREFKVEANLGKPEVSYKETVTAAAVGESRFVRQTGGRGQYGHVALRVSPTDPGEGLVFSSEIKRGAIPPEFIPAVEDGVEEAMQSGTIGGYPVVDVRVAVTDGSYHEVDSSDHAFRIAANKAFRDAYEKAQPVLLEPMMAVEVVTPEDYMGEVVQDLTKRGANIEQMRATTGRARTISALVPLAGMFGYSTSLRNVTQGRGTYVMEPHSYQRCENEDSG